VAASKPLELRIPEQGYRCLLVASLLAALALISFGAVPAHAAAADLTRTAGDSSQVDTLSAKPDTVRAIPDSTAAIPAAEPMLTDSAATTHLQNSLPFEQNELPHSYPEVSVSFGVAGYSMDVARVEDAFNKMEQVYIDAGYSLPPGKDVSPGAMYLATLTVWPSPFVDVACQAGQSQNEDNKITLVGGIISGHYTFPDARNVSVQVGLGGGGSGFSFMKRYGAQVSPVDGSGGFYSLESIELKGGGGYWTTQGGVTLRIGPHGAVRGLIQYLGMGDVSTTTARAGDITVNVSGTMFGASFILFY
jgi:hypothetical protein